MGYLFSKWSEQHSNTLATNQNAIATTPQFHRNHTKRHSNCILKKHPEHHSNHTAKPLNYDNNLIATLKSNTLRTTQNTKATTQQHPSNNLEHQPHTLAKPWNPTKTTYQILEPMIATA